MRELRIPILFTNLKFEPFINIFFRCSVGQSYIRAIKILQISPLKYSTASFAYVCDSLRLHSMQIPLHYTPLYRFCE